MSIAARDEKYPVFVLFTQEMEKAFRKQLEYFLCQSKRYASRNLDVSLLREKFQLQMFFPPTLKHFYVFLPQM